MKNNYPWRLWAGAGLIVMGVLALLETLGVLKFSGWLWSLLFFAGGAAFLSVTLTNKARWWGLIPGMALLGVGGEILLGSMHGRIAGLLGGAMVLGGLSLAFWLIYLLDRVQWWAIIPGGVLLTLAGVAVLGKTGEGLATGGVFMLGMGLTFALVALLTPKGTTGLHWAWFPAGILGIIGASLLFSAVDLMGVIFAAGLIGLGVLMAWRALKK